MRITISGRNIELTEGLKQAVEEKLSKLEKFFKPDTDVYVTLSVEKDRQKIEVTIPAKGHVIRSEQVSNDMYVSIDLVEEVIERQLRKYKPRFPQRSMHRRYSRMISWRQTMQRTRKSRLSVQRDLV